MLLFLFSSLRIRMYAAAYGNGGGVGVDSMVKVEFTNSKFCYLSVCHRDLTWLAHTHTHTHAECRTQTFQPKNQEQFAYMWMCGRLTSHSLLAVRLSMWLLNANEKFAWRFRCMDKKPPRSRASGRINFERLSFACRRGSSRGLVDSQSHRHLFQSI